MKKCTGCEYRAATLKQDKAIYNQTSNAAFLGGKGLMAFAFVFMLCCYWIRGRCVC